MAGENLELATIIRLTVQNLRGVSQLLEQNQQLEKELGDVEAQAVQTGGAINELGQQGGAGLNQLNTRLRANAQAMELVQKRSANLLKNIIETQGPTINLSNEFNRQQQLLSALQNRQRQYQSALRGLQSSSRQSQTAQRGLNDALRQQATATDAAAQNQERLATSARTLLNNTTGTARQLARLVEQEQRLAQSGAAAGQGLAQISRQADNAERSLRRNVSTLQNYESQLGESSQAAGLLRRAIAGLTAGLAAREFLRANSNLEQLNRSLTILKGSASASDEEIEFLRKTAERLGFRVGELSNDYVRFTAAIQESNFSAAEGREIFTNFVAALSNISASTAQVGLALQALSQIASKGTVSMEELRQQLGDQLPGAVVVLAKALGVTVAELTKLIEAGEVSADVLLKFSRKAAESFGANNQQRVVTYAAAVARLGNAWDRLLQVIGGTGAFDAVSFVIERSANLVASLTRSLASAGDDTEAGLTKAADNVDNIRKRAEDAAPKVEALKKVLDSLGDVEEEPPALKVTEAQVIAVEEKLFDLRIAMQKALTLGDISNPAISQLRDQIRATEDELELLRAGLDKVNEPAPGSDENATIASIRQQAQQAEADVASLEEKIERLRQSQARQESLGINIGTEIFDEIAELERLLVLSRQRAKELNETTAELSADESYLRAVEAAARLQNLLGSLTEDQRRFAEVIRDQGRAIGLNDEAILRVIETQFRYRQSTAQINNEVIKQRTELQNLVNQEQQFVAILDQIRARQGDQAAALSNINQLLEENRKKQRALIETQGQAEEKAKETTAALTEQQQKALEAAESSEQAARNLIALLNATKGTATFDEARLQATQALVIALQEERQAREQSANASREQADAQAAQTQEQDKFTQSVAAAEPLVKAMQEALAGARAEFAGNVEAAAIFEQFLTRELVPAIGGLPSLSEQAFGPFTDRASRATDEVKRLRQEITDLRVQGNQVRLLGVNEFINDVQIARRETQILIAEQEQAAQRLNDTLNSLSVEALRQRVTRVRDEFRLLDQEQLNGLERTLNARIGQLDTLAEQTDRLRQQFLRLQGDEVGAVQLENLREIAQIQGEINRLREIGDSQAVAILEEQLQLTTDINRIQEANARQQQKNNNNQIISNGNLNRSIAANTEALNEQARAQDAVTDAVNQTAQAQQSVAAGAAQAAKIIGDSFAGIDTGIEFRFNSGDLVSIRQELSAVAEDFYSAAAERERQATEQKVSDVNTVRDAERSAHNARIKELEEEARATERINEARVGSEGRSTFRLSGRRRAELAAEGRDAQRAVANNFRNLAIFGAS